MEHSVKSDLVERRVVKDVSERIEAAKLNADCGCCSILFDADCQNSRYGRLTVRSVAASVDEKQIQQLTDALGTVLKSQIEFIAVYDLREYQLPEMRFVKTLGTFCDAHAKDWLNLKVMALLIKDNLWASVAKGFIGMFTKMCPPHCPYIICHSENVAEHFIASYLPKHHNISIGGLQRAAGSGTSISSFVSVEDIVERYNAQPSSKLSRPTSLSSNLGSSLFRPASLGSNLGSSSRLVELHNGDVQVVQSRGSSDRLNGYDTADATNGNGLKLFGSHHSFKTVSSFESIASMANLPHQCSSDALKQLGAAYFHVDELMLDAREPAKRQGTSLSFFDFLFGDIAEQVESCFEKICKVLPCNCTLIVLFCR
eukprot:gnl/MRDRNA2_/MRDRNA2_35797_c0_seq1.p1 gnl/MRDRNA2_/MRDRNA2_35797_c0~~gnl/MRDRNA2_/MRDRNA2_35797_c0_seq1.p1  ORF type:complete len:370 (+),score=37.20 gnl/MRDRNA2_/MRDRNA2_35797_c0_seq1:67-1176(+)